MRLRFLLVFLTLLPPLSPLSPRRKPASLRHRVLLQNQVGHADEFLQLFKKNHYPLLKREVEMGRMLKVWMDQPRYHTTEDGRWDYRVTIVFKNATVANEPSTKTRSRSSFGPIRPPI